MFGVIHVARCFVTNPRPFEVNKFFVLCVPECNRVSSSLTWEWGLMCTIRNNLLYYIFSVLCSLTKDSQTECDLAAINCLQYCSRFVSRCFVQDLYLVPFLKQTPSNVKFSIYMRAGKPLHHKWNIHFCRSQFISRLQQRHLPHQSNINYSWFNY